jgi:predicted lipoprotein with Yx(FWY)xxD motif
VNAVTRAHRGPPTIRPSPTRAVAVAFVAAVSLAASACSGGDDAGADADALAATTTTDGSRPPAPASPGETGTGTGAPPSTEGGADVAVTVAVAATDLGETLVDGDARTLYVFDEDTPGEPSTCTAACADAWPPLVVDGAPVLGDGLDPAAFTTITRPGGGAQLAVEGRPLYRFAGDAAPGDTTGHGSQGLWWAVGPDGAPRPESSSGGLGY